jgi:hypothetical protein
LTGCVTGVSSFGQMIWPGSVDICKDVVFSTGETDSISAVGGIFS